MHAAAATRQHGATMPSWALCALTVAARAAFAGSARSARAAAPTGEELNLDRDLDGNRRPRAA